MTYRHILTLIAVALCATLNLGAQTDVEKADRDFAEFRRIQSAGNADGAAYGRLRDAYAAYRQAIADTRPDTPERQHLRAALRDVFPYLRQAAYYYAAANDQAMVLRFAADYIDLSLLPAMGEDRLNESPGYPVLANLAATNIYNRGDYQNAILYFQAYLSSGDTANRELAFEGLARSYYELRNYDNAVYIAAQGAATYPRNWNMLIVGIESAGRNGNDTHMEQFLEKALAIKPGHNGLLEYKGKMLERMKRYDEAAATFRTLAAANPSSLDYACHLAFDLYNSGVKAMPSDSARMRFQEAIPLLDDILANSPYAVNVAHALAVCYNMTGQTDKLRQANATLTALRAPEVAQESVPAEESAYMPQVNYTPAVSQPVAAADQPADVDINIPIAKAERADTYVMIIGNENYKYFSDVAYAHRDGKTFAEYCRKALGVPADNIRERYDATLSEIREPLRYLEEKCRMNPDRLNIIVYYAGHGVPDVARGTAHLLPTDASGTDFESCLELDRLYSMLDEMPARSVTVFLDACFSGATRGNEMLFAERFVEYEVEDAVAKGKTVVFSATTGKQTAMAYDDKRHGFFTYYLLKSLQESGGEITLGELAERLTREVDNKAFDKKNKHQTPTVNASAALGDEWKSRRLSD